MLSLAGAAWAGSPLPLAPGYGPLGFEPPVPGAYALPVVQPAADGDILLSSGEPARLHDLLGDKLVLLSFIYSNCSDVNGCPLATAVLQGVKQAMAKDLFSERARNSADEVHPNDRCCLELPFTPPAGTIVRHIPSTAQTN